MLDKCFCHQEGKRMGQEDRLSDLTGLVERKVIEEKIVSDFWEKQKIVVQEKIVFEERIVYVEKADSRPEPKFSAGQAVHQWWAPWMANAAQPPIGIKAKSRPSWFSSSVFVVEQLCPQSCRDAGVPGTDRE